MREPGGWIRWLAPRQLRAGAFDPAMHDALRERRVRLRRARGWPGRAGVAAWFAWRALSAALECRAAAASDTMFSFGSARPLMIRHDLTFTVRMLRKAPGFTLAAVCATALGIGANTAIFTVVRHVLLQPLPYPAPDRLVAVNEYAHGNATAVSPPNFVDWRAATTTLASITGYNEQVVTLAAGETEPSRIGVALVDEAFAGVTGVAPLLGRSFGAADVQPGGRKVVVLGYGLWQQAFGGDRGVVSRQIQLEGEPYEVIGVMPRGFDFPDASDAWLPLRLDAHDLGDTQRGAHYLSAVGRLAPGVTAAAATADLDAIEQRIAARFPSRVGGYTVAAVPLLASMVGDVQRPLLVLAGAVAFVLLIACVNVANLLLARATTRTGEIAVRAALGAGRARLVAQMIAESVVLALAGGAAGLLLAAWGVRALTAVAPADLPRADGIAIDGPILVFTVVLSMVAGIVFGTVPALLASRPNLAVFLRDAGRDAGAAGGRRRLRAVLVTAQVALALVLLASAGLALRSFQRLTRVDPGFRTGNVLTFDISLPEAAYATKAAQAMFFRDLTSRLAAIPGVAAAGAVSMPPVTRDGFGGTFTVFGRPPGQDEGSAQIRSMTPGYFPALSIPIVAGRGLTDLDAATSAPVAVVSESAARRFWPGENPVGKQLRLHVNEPKRLVREIVGIAGDVRTRGMELEPVPVVYVPHAQYGPESMTLAVRGSADPRALLPQMKSVLRELAPAVAMGRARPLDALVAANVAQPRFRTLLLSVFATVALILAAVGLYGVVAFSVNQRRPELSVRMALGADRREVLRLVLREGMAPVAVGIGLGLAGAAAAGRVMATLLFGVEPFDPLTFAAVAATLVAVGFAACYIPALRATEVDPAASLR
jgi:putative ABC transport system permease protein